MSWFGDAFDWVGDIFGGDTGNLVDPLFGGYDAGSGTFSSFGGGGGLFDSVGSWLGNNAGTIAKAGFGAAATAFGGGSGTASRSSNISYKQEYPAAQGQKAADAGTPRGLRSVDPESLARMWMSKMSTIYNKYR